MSVHLTSVKSTETSATYHTQLTHHIKPTYSVVCRACFCTFYTSEMKTHSYMPFLFSINFLCHLC